MDDGSTAGTVVLVHGGFVDGSGWQGVYQQLTKDGYTVGVVQNPTLSLAGDVDATRRVIDAQTEPVILVGHSYGGAVITEAGTDPNVKALVYIAGFMPDAGESVQTLIADLPPETGPPILPPQDGFLLLDRAKFHQAFAGDVDDDLAEFMADSQVPWGLDAATGTISEPAWRSKPSWYLVTTDDRMIPRRSSARCRRAPVRQLSRPRAAIRFTSHSRPLWPTSSREPLRKWDQRRWPRAKPTTGPPPTRSGGGPVSSLRQEGRCGYSASPAPSKETTTERSSVPCTSASSSVAPGSARSSVS
jgi:pimeloyl-ACP methyl ester carboxylesterase